MPEPANKSILAERGPVRDRLLLGIHFSRLAKGRRKAQSVVNQCGVKWEKLS